MQQQPCFCCNGYGNQLGKGLGSRCTTCQGTGKKSTNVQPCFGCEGKGTQNGFGSGSQCSACKGKGEKSLIVQACFCCLGKGTQNGFGSGYKCTTCDGTGERPMNQVPCPKCNGKGSDKGFGLGSPCAHCNRKGGIVNPKVPPQLSNVPSTFLAANLTNLSHDGYKLVEILPNNLECLFVKEMVESQLGTQCKITKIERIDNPNLRKAFLTRCSKLLDPKIPTTFKFNVSTPITSIIQDGFKLENSGIYGEGIYFGKIANSVQGAALLCEVAIGKYLTCSLPQSRLNSTILNQCDSVFAANEDQFVVYDKDQALPRYIVYYSYHYYY